MLETIALRDDERIGTFSWRMSEEVAKYLQDAQVALRGSSQRTGLSEEHWDRAFEELVRAIEDNIRGSLSIISASITIGPLGVDYLRRMDKAMRALGLEIISELSAGGGKL